MWNSWLWWHIHSWKCATYKILSMSKCKLLRCYPMFPLPGLESCRSTYSWQGQHGKIFRRNSQTLMFGVHWSLTLRDTDQVPGFICELVQPRGVGPVWMQGVSKLPPPIVQFKRMRVLQMRRTALEDLAEDLSQLERLADANFQGCKQFQSLRDWSRCQIHFWS